MKYRPDIDGLRAVAVIPVVLFHAGLPFMKGGYVGVDVFFVLSGFLITSILTGEFDRGAFSLLGFYERRARRILPALMVATLATLLIGGFILLPAAYEDLGESVIAAALFGSNVFFWLSLDYFAPDAEFVPLLHTWSLAVEEQFYIVFPLLLWGIYRFGLAAHCRTILLALVTGSFILSVIAVEVRPTMAFYTLPFRAWELGLGSLLAVAPRRASLGPALNEALAVLGLLGILLPVFFYSADTPFPGIAALPPVLGTAALIYTGSKDGFVHRALRQPALVFVGLISYSLYLWHWPILALMRAGKASIHLTAGEALTAVVLSACLAWLSYRFVEQPFRRRIVFPHRRGLLIASGTALAGSVALGAGLIWLGGMPARFSPQILTAALGKTDTNPHKDLCMGPTPQEGLCVLGRREVKRETDFSSVPFLLWGDSHANAIAPGVDSAARASGVAVATTSRGACPPVPGILREGWRYSQGCERSNARVLDHLRSTSDFGTVILAARWTLSVEGSRYGEETGAAVILRWKDAVEPADGTIAENGDVLRPALRDLVDAIQSTGRTVILLGPSPEVGWDVPTRLVQGFRTDRPIQTTLPRPVVADRTAKTVSLLRDVAADTGAEYIDLIDTLCTPDCPLVIGDAPVYVDDNHLSATAARAYIAPVLQEVFHRRQHTAAVQ